MVVVISDFFSSGKYTYLLPSFSIIYGAILSIFVGTKEFGRWYDNYHPKRHPGEIFVIVWSILLLAMLIFSWLGPIHYRISSDIISVYIMVLTVFAITQGSKRLYKNKREK